MIQLLDTNVVSEIRKIGSGRADAGVASWLERQSQLDLYLSVVSVCELERGVQRAERRDSRQGALLREWLDDKVVPAFKGRILDIDVRVALKCAQLRAHRTCEISDAFIAATALENRMTLVTRNIAHFQPLGVRVLNPWLS